MAEISTCSQVGSKARAMTTNKQETELLAVTQAEFVITAWAIAHDIDGAARNDLFARLRLEATRAPISRPVSGDVEAAREIVGQVFEEKADRFQQQPLPNNVAIALIRKQADEVRRGARDDTEQMKIALAALSSAGQAEGWRDIESARRQNGGRMILAWDDCPSLSYHWEVGRWSRDKGWVNTYGHPFSGEPTHWMIPAPPATTDQAKGER